ncbi:MAG: putative competence-damage inducible protein [Candidatus Omnitrophica bacterium]|nr:putative competence-damage inducible protein [Candidatus Omnitrophota bacterium]
MCLPGARVYNVRMLAEILSVGTELLLGTTLNTNARYLAERLAEISVDVHRHVTVGDNPARLRAAFEEASRRADLIITTGGLGPTEDDVTMASFAAFAGLGLRRDPRTIGHITRQLARRGKQLTPLIERQSLVPVGARIFQNPVGTAPAVLARVRRRERTVHALLLPGPPREMRPLYRIARAHLVRLTPRSRRTVFVVRRIRITGPTEAEVASHVPDLLKLPPPLTVGIYAKPGEVELRAMCKARTRPAADRALSRIERDVRRRLGPAVYGTGESDLPAVVGELLHRSRMTLATAESCTGGLLSKLLTDVPGSSSYFLGGVVSYHDRIKRRFLGVPAALLKRHGAVSRQVALRMAAEARRRFGSDVAVAITGVAGPAGGSAIKPVGSVHIALADRRGARCELYRFTGNREDVRARAAHKALDLLRLRLLVQR